MLRRDRMPGSKPRAARGLGRVRRVAAPVAVLLLAGAGLAASEAPSLPGAPPPALGVRLTFEKLLERRDARRRNLIVSLGCNSNFPNSLARDADPEHDIELRYSSLLETVFELGGPGYLPARPDYFLYDGAYYTFAPESYDDPSLRVRALPRDWQQQRLAGDQFREFYRARQHAALGAEKQGAGQGGLQVTVPIHMPGALAEVFGRGATNIKVSGRENISFAGESRRVAPFVATETGRGQSLFPRLDMKQELNVKLDGTIGDKVHVQVDHNSAAFGADANKINIYYEGYDDDIVRRLDMGGTNMGLPGSNLTSFAGGARGLFGVKSAMRLGGLDLTVVASKEEADVETRTLTPTGGSAARPIVVQENGFARDRFFFYEKPDTTVSFYRSYGLDPGHLDNKNTYVPGQLIQENQVANFHVFVDTRDRNTELQRTYRGFAVEELPAGDDTTAMRAAYDDASDARRWPAGDKPPAHWKELDPSELGWVFYKIGDKTLVLGFFLRSGPFGSTDAVGVTFDDPTFATVGKVDVGQSPPQVRLRLVRHPEQDQDFYVYPTSQYMMRHVYVLGTTNINNLDLKIVNEAAGRPNPDRPDHLPSSTYLHMFGLDDLNEGGQTQPDDKFDFLNPNLIEKSEGFLFMPGTRPFSPPREIVAERLRSIPGQVSQSDSLFPSSETVLPILYTLPPTDPRAPQRKFHLEATTVGTETEIILQQDIIEGSEVVRLDGTTLERGKDYDVDPVAGGKITLKGAALTRVNPQSRLEVTYQFRPLFGGGKSTLLGASGEYQLGAAGKLSSVWLYESTAGFTRHPKLGEEPSRTLLGDLNTNFQFKPRWMTSLINRLPFTNTTGQSTLNLAAEAAISVPNPNTKNEALVDDLEGADDSDDQNLSRTTWHWASIPVPRRSLGDEDYTVDRPRRVPACYYNPVGSVKRGHLNPTLNKREVNDGISVLEVGFDRDRAQSLIDSLPARGVGTMWTGIMKAFPGVGIDMSRTKSIEFWLNDYQDVPSTRHGKLHIDFGELSEDFVLFDDTHNFGDNRPHFNREAVDLQHFDPLQNDLGWDGRASGDCGAEGQPFNSECYLPERRNSWFQHYLADGTEGNHSYDTEDINENGDFDTQNRYFSIEVDLASPQFVITDVNPQYGPDPAIPADLKSYFYGWRKYRIDLDRVVLEKVKDNPGLLDPSLRQIHFLRLWFEDTSTPAGTPSLFAKNLQIYGLRLTRNQWLQLGVFATDSTQVAPRPGETFTVGVINNKDDAAIYTMPPASTELDQTGVQAREQALRLDFSGLEPGREMVAERILGSAGRGLDFTQYRRLDYFVHYSKCQGGGGPPCAAATDSAEFFFRVGTDTLNYYEVAHSIPSTQEWLEVAVDLDALTALKFPTDYPGGATVMQLARGAQRFQQVTATVLDAKSSFHDVPLRVTRRGEPSLRAVSRFFVGVRHRFRPPPVDRLGGGSPRWTGPQPGPVSGEVWFDNVRLEQVERTIGMSQFYSVQSHFGDVLDISGRLTRKDAEYRGLRERAGAGNQVMSWKGDMSSDLSKLLPTAGFSMPFNLSYSRDQTLPKFSNQSDTRNNEARQVQQRTESTQGGFSFTLAKRASKFWLLQTTLDHLAFSYGESRTANRAYVSRDTSVARSRSLKYDLSPQPRQLRVFRGLKLNLVPTTVGFSFAHRSSRTTQYTVRWLNRGTLVDSLVRNPSPRQRSIDFTATAAMRPLPFLGMRYTLTEPRDYRETHPSNAHERLSLFGVDLGMPKGRGEGLSIDLTPKRFRFTYAANFNDNRLVHGKESPEVHSVGASHSRTLSFDLGLHRRLGRWFGAKKKASGPEVWTAPETEPVPPGREPDPRRDDEDKAPPPAPPDTSEAPLFRPEPGAASGDSLAPVLPPAGSAGAGAPAPVPGPAPPDSLKARERRRLPDPFTFLLRKISEIEPVKVEYSDTRSAAYSNLLQLPSRLFRYGFTRRSGISGFDLPPAEDWRRSVDLSTTIPLRGTLRLGTRFKRDESMHEAHTTLPAGISTNQQRTLDYTFPSFDLSIANIQRIRIFGPRLERSSLSLGYTRAVNRTSSRDVGVRPRPGPERTSERYSVNANWTGQWKGEMSTSLSGSQTFNGADSPGNHTETMQRTIQSGVRFKLAPKGGLKVPFFGGNLKSGMDLSLNVAYNTDASISRDASGKDFGSTRSKALSTAARGDYTLSRNINGGVEIGFSRNSSVSPQGPRTTTAIKLGFNLSFMF